MAETNNHFLQWKLVISEPTRISDLEKEVKQILSVIQEVELKSDQKELQKGLIELRRKVRKWQMKFSVGNCKLHVSEKSSSLRYTWSSSGETVSLWK